MHKSPRRPRHRHAFTLVELLIVLLILGLLGSIAVPRYMKHVRTAKMRTAKTQIALLRDAVHDYYMDLDEYPKRLDDLVDNPGGETWDGPYLNPPKLPLDPWGEPYRYDFPGKHGEFDIYSYGADKAPGGTKDGADITSWE